MNPQAVIPGDETRKSSVTKKPDGTTTTQETQTTPLTGGTTTGGTMADTNTGFKYPEQWQQAADLWSQMASGNYSNAGTDWLTQMLQGGGNPVDVQGWANARRPAMMDEYSNMVKEMAERAGVGGTRYGSGLQNQIATYGGQLQNQFNQDLADRWMGSQESAMGRALSGAGTLGGLGLGAQTTGGQGLMQSGWDYSTLPMQVATQMSGFGNQLNSQDMGWAGLMGPLTGNQYSSAQTYTPTWFQSLLQNVLPLLPTSSGGSSGTGLGAGGWA